MDALGGCARLSQGEREGFVTYSPGPGGQAAPGLGVLALQPPIEASQGLTGCTRWRRAKTEWIISNTAGSNSTNLSFSSLGSRFALSEREEKKKEQEAGIRGWWGREEREREGGRRRWLESCAFTNQRLRCVRGAAPPASPVTTSGLHNILDCLL